MLVIILEVIVAALVLGLVWWLVTQIPGFGPFARIVQVVCVVLFVIWIIYILMGLVGGHHLNL
jgi:VIT1/CCC1 family predicted Fe2+/Mn2+ transporter